MFVSKHVPWQMKIAAKLVLSRIPLNYETWKRIGIFKAGAMERPEYALGVFRRHFNAATFTKKSGDFVGLEMGPGDSLDSAVIAKSFGAARTYLVDIEHFATSDLACYRRMEQYLRQSGLQPPDLSECKTLADFERRSSACYLTKGLESLRRISTASIDFLWSHAVLEHVRRDEFAATLKEMRRIQRLDGIGSHRISISDILGGKLNDLRFSERVWESKLMSRSGFYTNRIRYGQLMDMFKAAGFAPEIRKITRWPSLPTPRKKLAPQFASLPDDDLCISGFDVYLR